ncbi:MAG: ATP-grasp domain-containing protein [Armatimonadetes bacterium]|nr:ATP-grasp domain-containing protein [Armatimonadota bacterium]
MRQPTRHPALVLGDINLIRCLGRVGVPVTMAAADVRGSGARSRYCQRAVPLPAEGGIQTTLQALMSVPWPEGATPALFYQSDDDLLLVSRGRNVLARRYRFIVPPEPLVEDLVDKSRFLDLALRLDLPIPRTRVLRPGADVAAQLAGWEVFPAILKQSVHASGWDALLPPGSVAWAQKAIRVGTRHELDRLRPALDGHPGELVLQETIEGGEERIVSFHAYVRPGGECVSWFTGRKVRTFPRAYGRSTCVDVTDEAPVRDLGFQVLERLTGFHGVLKMDFKEHPESGRLSLLEINPRFNLWHYPGAAAGANLPALVYRDLYGLDWRLPTRARPGVRWVWLDGDLRSYLEQRRAGELSLGGWLRSLCARSVYQPFAWDDPMPMLTALWQPIARRRSR